MDSIWTQHYAPGVPSRLSYPELTLPDLLNRSATAFPDRPAIRFYGRTIRYRELNRLANRFAQALIGLQVRKGTVIGLMLPNLPQAVIGYFGGLRAGALVTPINPLYVESEIEHQVTDSGCELVL